MHSVFPAILIAATAAVAQSPASSASSAETEYRKGAAAEKAGNPDAARQAYTRALQLDPRHAHARYSLGQLKINAGAIAAKGREVQFAALPVADYRVSDLTLKEALAVLAQRIESTGKEVAPNFIIADPSRKLDAARITLSLKNVPAGGILRHILSQAGAKERYDEHAIVLSPR